MATDKLPVEPNADVGRKLGQKFLGGGAPDTLALDPDRLYALAQVFAQRANAARQNGEKVATVGSDALAQSTDFRDQYQPDGAYGSDYGSMESGDTDMSDKSMLVSERADAVAGGLQWLADRWEDIQAGNVKLVEEVDTDIMDGAESTSSPSQPSEAAGGATTPPPTPQPETRPVSGSGSLMDDVSDVKPA